MIEGILTAIGWIVIWGLFAAMAFALETPGITGWYDRWIVRPAILLWVFGGALVLFLHFSFGLLG